MHAKSICLNLGKFVVHPNKQNPGRYTELIGGNSFSILRAVENLALLADKKKTVFQILFSIRNRMKAFFRNNLQNEVLVFWLLLT